MFSRASKLRFRRGMRLRQRQVVGIGEEAEQHLDQHFFKRLERLLPVRRFVAAWLALVILLISGVIVQTIALGGYYQQLVAAPGGVYSEGIVGEFSNANPIFAISAADKTISRLVFSSLLTYNDKNQLVGDLAESWQADSRGKVYTVSLKKNIKWQDGVGLTANDVVYTYKTIQNADAQSPLRLSWQDVNIELIDTYTVKFTLHNPLASFPYSLSNGIVPQHLLADIQPSDLRASSFNTVRPIGSGPFKWQAIESHEKKTGDREVKVALVKYPDYHLGSAKLDGFTIRVFEKEDSMVQAMNNHELNAIAGLIESPNDLADSTNMISFSQTAAEMVFFRVNSEILNDKLVRQALVGSTNRARIRASLSYIAPFVDSPLLKGQLGYDPAINQQPFDIAKANSLLDSAGWIKGPDGFRAKNGVPLAFSLAAEKNKETTVVSNILKNDWKAIGVNLSVALQDRSEFQTTLTSHSYDALLRGISIGIDPDVFPYWHSSQAGVLSTKLNFSEFNSAIADASLEAARTRLDPKLRAEKYKPFLKAWADEAPAVGLYQPRSLYIVRGNVFGLEPHSVNSATDRFANVNQWMIRRVKTTVD